jgi:feruloyl esterase
MQTARPPQKWKRVCAITLTFLIFVEAALSTEGGKHAADRNPGCDDSLKYHFAPDANTEVLLVRPFRRGDRLELSKGGTEPRPIAANDVCLVKLLVGPGNPGPTGAPSTSKGIGIEIWLPAPIAWNGRVHALGGGGWVGGLHSALDAIASPEAAAIAGMEGAVSSASDAGHGVYASPLIPQAQGAFAMKPDGTMNVALWRDFASRAIYEQAVKTRALATLYYGSAPKHTYWEGGSNGGRQGLKLAQDFPELYDGIIANFPAINWTRFVTTDLYPQVVFQRDLGGAVPSHEQQDMVSNAAIDACDVIAGEHLGYILDPSACTYDPTKDVKVLCVSDGGQNASPACITRAQADAMNKIWYGMTTDGSAPDPAIDNGWNDAKAPILPAGKHRWFGPARGTSLYGASFVAYGLVGLTDSKGPFILSSDQVALELQNSALAEATFVNATGNGQSQWKQLTYAQLSNAFERGIALDATFSHVNSDNPDLSAFRKHGGKMLTRHGLSDEVIMPQGTVNYYERVAAQMGGLAAVQSFYRLYMVPGLGHGTPNGTSNPKATPPDFAPNQSYQLITDWIEKGKAPETLVLQSGSGKSARSMPICIYPRKPTYKSGSPNMAASYFCS